VSIFFREGMARPLVYLDVDCDGKPLGRLMAELFPEVAPRSAENFRALCTGERGAGAGGKPLHYKGSVFFRSIKGILLQGGDIENNNGSGGESIYGKHFDDEGFAREHHYGSLSMANTGPNQNGSQFFIILGRCPDLDGKHVVFGQITEESKAVLKKIQQVKVNERDCPTKRIVVRDCGELAGATLAAPEAGARTKLRHVILGKKREREEEGHEGGGDAMALDDQKGLPPAKRMRRVDGSPIAVKALRDHVDTRTQLKELKAVARVRELKRLKRRGRRAAKKRRR